ncbi:MAG: biotin--[acetyl-CoA-carboxylase] ligase, partial [Angustibacter sp.]
SVVLRPRTPVASWSWLPLLAGLAISQALDSRTGLSTAVKWPNDVLIGEKKVAGVLAEVGDARTVVLGFGVNIHQLAGELPVPTATSVALAGGNCTDRQPILLAILRQLGRTLSRWAAEHQALSGQDAPHIGVLGRDYRERCATLGRQVRVVLPGGRQLLGVVEGIDESGQLVLRSDDGLVHEVAAGDVVHVRPRAD